MTSAIGFGGFVGPWGLPAASDFIGRRLAGIVGFVAGAVFLYAFTRIGADVLVLFTLLFLASALSFGLLALLTGPVATEAAPPGRISTIVGAVIGVGEIFGGGLALVVTHWRSAISVLPRCSCWPRPRLGLGGADAVPQRDGATPRGSDQPASVTPASPKPGFAHQRRHSP